MSNERYRLIGSTASPYAIKLRALMRYRRIPFDWVIMTKALRKQTEHLRPNLIPILQYPDGAFREGALYRLREGASRSEIGSVDDDSLEAGWVALNIGMFEADRPKKDEQFEHALSIARASRASAEAWSALVPGR